MINARLDTEESYAKNVEMICNISRLIKENAKSAHKYFWYLLKWF